MHVYDRTLAASGGVAKANQSSGRLRRSMAPDLSPDCVFLQKTLHGREIDPLGGAIASGEYFLHIPLIVPIRIGQVAKAPT
jgi:hypothetical protein